MIRSRLIPSETLVRKRQTNFGVFDPDGFPQAPVFETDSFIGNVQPLSGLEILQVPEGDRTREILNIWKEFELLAKDIVIRNGIDFEVQNPVDWIQPLTRLSHKKVRIVKVDVER